eukprot:2967184-Lingulodinium_polyedra.AAC.1
MTFGTDERAWLQRRPPGSGAPGRCRWRPIFPMPPRGSSWGAAGPAEVGGRFDLEVCVEATPRCSVDPPT